MTWSETGNQSVGVIDCRALFFFSSAPMGGEMVGILDAEKDESGVFRQKLRLGNGG
jgi:hypothetical protein